MGLKRVLAAKCLQKHAAVSGVKRIKSQHVMNCVDRKKRKNAI